jgi:uncharacterized membrane protein YphA (DoxX/SURF4 family)
MLMPILYAGLAGTVLALLVATRQQNWSLRVLFLLALRLAIGWHFLFEGLHKLHTHEIGPSEYSRPFSSEMYFKVAPGPLAPIMRSKFETDTEPLESKLKGAKGDIPAAQFAKMPPQHQSAMCPPSIGQIIDDLFVHHQKEAIQAIEEEADKEKAAAEAALAKAKTDAEKKDATEAIAAAKEKREKAAVTLIDRKEGTKRKYAAWAYGVTPRDTKIKGFAQDVPMTAPQRLAQIEFLRNRVTEEEERLKTGMGNGFGIDQKKAAELRMELATAESDLRKDINAFVEELKKEFMGSAKVPAAEPPPPSEGQKMDQFTMWFLIAVGGCIMAGFLTRIACVAGCGFLVLTYLTHPPFPWFPLPPGTEGNPVFINKNVIEGLALLVLATFPTGRWLGIDALFACIFGCGRKNETQA